MELTTIMWRSGVDHFHAALREDAAKNLCSNSKAKMPMPLTLDFGGKETALGQVLEVFWAEDDKSINVRFEIPPETEQKWLGFDWAHSIRPAWKVNSTYKSQETGNDVIANVTLLEVSVCAGIPPNDLPDPYRMI